MDHRDQAARMPQRLTPSPDGRRVFFELEDDDGNEERFSLPARFHVCPTCEGTGSHVNPSIDAHGITGAEMAEDPDFEAAYFGGRYDVACYECKGQRVVVDVDGDAIKTDEEEELLRRLDDLVQEDRDFIAVQDAERRMGA